MRVIYSSHSVKQNKLRKIPKSRIRLAVEKPDQVLLSFRERKLYRKTFGDTTLEVVGVEERGKIVIVTQYYLEDL